jgi:hypothetical protein
LTSQWPCRSALSDNTTLTRRYLPAAASLLRGLARSSPPSYPSISSLAISAGASRSAVRDYSANIARHRPPFNANCYYGSGSRFHQAAAGRQKYTAATLVQAFDGRERTEVTRASREASRDTRLSPVSPLEQADSRRVGALHIQHLK